MTASETQDFELVLTTRHALVALFIAVVALGTFGGVSYIAGRSIDAGAVAAAASPMEVSSDPVAIVVDPIGETAPMAAQPLLAESASKSYFRNPQPGQIFLQVVAVDRGPAEVFAEYLTRKGFTAQVASGPDERSYRVLVGPLQTSSEIDASRNRLQTEGFRPFVQKF